MAEDKRTRSEIGENGRVHAEDNVEVYESGAERDDAPRDNVAERHTVGVYDRPERTRVSPTTTVAILIVVLIIAAVLAYFLFPGIF